MWKSYTWPVHNTSGTRPPMPHQCHPAPPRAGRGSHRPPAKAPENQGWFPWEWTVGELTAVAREELIKSRTWWSHSHGFHLQAIRSDPLLPFLPPLPSTRADWVMFSRICNQLKLRGALKKQKRKKLVFWTNRQTPPSPSRKLVHLEVKQISTFILHFRPFWAF